MSDESYDNWFALIGEFLAPGRGWPDSYLVLDTETSGLDNERDFVIELGWARADGGAVSHSGALLLDWTRPEYAVYHDQIRAGMRKAGEHMRSKGRSYRFTFDGLAEGEDPREVLGDFADMLAEDVAGGLAVVGHNVWSFDRVMLHRNVWRAAGRSLAFPYSNVFDTAAVEKARQLELWPPEPGESSPERWYTMLATRRTSCNLDEHCNRVYGLKIDAKKAHTAEYDCIVTHRLLEAMKALAAEDAEARP